MANQITIIVILDGSGNTCGLAQFGASDTLAVAIGGSIPTWDLVVYGETMIEGTTFIQMDAGDTATMQVYVASGPKTIDLAASANNHWEGFLVG